MQCDHNHTHSFCLHPQKKKNDHNHTFTFSAYLKENCEIEIDYMEIVEKYKGIFEKCDDFVNPFNFLVITVSK